MACIANKHTKTSNILISYLEQQAVNNTAYTLETKFVSTCFKKFTNFFLQGERKSIVQRGKKQIREKHNSDLRLTEKSVFLPFLEAS